MSPAPSERRDFLAVHGHRAEHERFDVRCIGLAGVGVVLLVQDVGQVVELAAELAECAVADQRFEGVDELVAGHGFEQLDRRLRIGAGAAADVDVRRFDNLPAALGLAADEADVGDGVLAAAGAAGPRA